LFWISPTAESTSLRRNPPKERQPEKYEPAG